MARKCKEDAEKTRQAVLESALDVFSEKGFAKATFDEIAARAGFTKGAVYWYFRNKADLVAALINEYVGRKRIELAPVVPEGNSLDDLLNYFVLWAEASERDQRFSRFNRFVSCQMEWSEAVIDRVDKAMAWTKNHHLEKIKAVLVESKNKGELRDDVNIEVMPHVIMSTYMGIIFSVLSKRVNFSMVDMVHAGLKALLDGIKNEGGKNA